MAPGPGGRDSAASAAPSPVGDRGNSPEGRQPALRPHLVPGHHPFGVGEDPGGALRAYHEPLHHGPNPRGFRSLPPGLGRTSPQGTSGRNDRRPVHRAPALDARPMPLKKAGDWAPCNAASSKGSSRCGTLGRRGARPHEAGNCSQAPPAFLTAPPTPPCPTAPGEVAARSPAVSSNPKPPFPHRGKGEEGASLESREWRFPRKAFGCGPVPVPDRAPGVQGNRVRGRMLPMQARR